MSHLTLRHATAAALVAVLCMLLGFVQVRRGVSPINQLRNRLTAVQKGIDLRVDGSYPARSVVRVDRQGHDQPLLSARGAYRFPSLSPDGQTLAVTLEVVSRGTDGSYRGDQSDIWLYGLTRSTVTRLTFDGKSAYPIWTPDGRRVTFASYNTPPQSLFWKLADGSGVDEQLMRGNNPLWPGSWSPDGKTLAVMEQNPITGGDILMLPATPEARPKAFISVPLQQWGGRFSPDGRWVAYSSIETGRWEVFVQPYPGPGGKWQVSTEGGQEAVWARNGREIFYRNDDKMMAVAVDAAPTFTAAVPQLLFKGFATGVPGLPAYDVAPDGRFVMLKESTGTPAMTQFNVVLNWYEELKQRVPVK